MSRNPRIRGTGPVTMSEECPRLKSVWAYPEVIRTSFVSAEGLDDGRVLRGLSVPGSGSGVGKHVCSAAVCVTPAYIYALLHGT